MRLHREKRNSRRLKPRSFRTLHVEPLEMRRVMASFPVTTVDDAGSGSLRETIVLANSSPGADEIVFAIPGTGPHTIRPLSALPLIDDALTIDGYTQPGAAPNTLAEGTNANLQIELDGSLAGDGINGLALSGGNSTIRGLAINRFSGSGILAAFAGGENYVFQGNFIGTDVTGTLALGNAGDGIELIDAYDSLVGGTAPADRNLVSANLGSRPTDLGSSGHGLIGWRAHGLQIFGNLIGTDTTGTSDLGNASNGVFLAFSNNVQIGGSATGAGNLISGNAEYGVAIVNAVGADIQGNRIGTDVTGTQALSRQHAGVFVTYGNDAIRIGGTDAAEGNLITGNDIGVDVLGSGVTVQGNRIGTDIFGLPMTLGNVKGIGLRGDATGNLIGGSLPGAGNLVAGNRDYGFWIAGTDVHDNTIQGNVITDNGFGIYLESGSNSNIIGLNLADEGDGNTITRNETGIVLLNSTGAGNTIRGNSINFNLGLGIELSDFGPNPNDLLDADEGPNGLQNYPELTSVASANTTRVVGSLSSTPNAAFIVDVYASAVPDESGFGEGQRYLGHFDITTDASGLASFDSLVFAPSTAGEFISATATDSNGNTSEFSYAVASVSGVQSVQIDVLRDLVNINSNADIQVAVITDTNFDAAKVNASTVVFAGARSVAHSLTDIDQDGDLDLVLQFHTRDTNLAAIYAQLLADDINGDGVLDSNRQTASVSLTGQTVDATLFEGFDSLDLFLSGKKLRDLLDELAAAGVI